MDEVTSDRRLEDEVLLAMTDGVRLRAENQLLGPHLWTGKSLFGNVQHDDR